QRLRLRAAIQNKGRLQIKGPTEPDHQWYVRLGIECLPRPNDDKRTVEPAGQLQEVVPMRVVDERSRPRRCEPRDERLPRLDRWRHLGSRAAPAGHAIVIAVELDAMPVNGRGFAH